MKLYKSVGANVVSFPYGPMTTQPLGWFKKRITKADDFKGMKYRTVGMSIDIFTGLGAAVNALPGAEIVPAMDRGLLDAAEFNNASSDRAARLPRRLQDLHVAELPPERRAVRDHCSTRPSTMRCRKRYGRSSPTALKRLPQELTWKAIDRYSKDYVEMQTKRQRQVLPHARFACCKTQLDVWDTIVAKKSADNPMFKEVVRIADGVRRTGGQMGDG